MASRCGWRCCTCSPAAPRETSPRNATAKNATTKSRRHEAGTKNQQTNGLSAWFRVFVAKNVATTKDAEVHVRQDVTKRLLKGGRVVDPANGRDGTFDVLIDGGRIAKVGRDLPVDAGVAVVDIPSGLV